MGVRYYPRPKLALVCATSGAQTPSEALRRAPGPPIRRPMTYDRCAYCCAEIRGRTKTRPIPEDAHKQRVLPPEAQKFRDDCERGLNTAQRNQIGINLHACFPQGCLKLVEQECAALASGALPAHASQPWCPQPVCALRYRGGGPPDVHACACGLRLTRTCTSPTQGQRGGRQPTTQQ